MKTSLRITLVVLLLIAVAGGAVWAYIAKHTDSDPDQVDNDQLQSASHVSTEDGNVELKFDLHAQQINGISVVTLVSGQHQATIQGTGSVLQLQPLLDLKTSYNAAQMELAKAHAASQSSQSEYNRLLKLNLDGQNASAKSVEAARAAAESDQAIALNAERNLTLVKDSMQVHWGKQIAEAIAEDSAEFNALVSQSAFLLQVAPTGTAIWSKPPSEAIAELPDGSHATAQLWSALPQVDARLQTSIFLYRIAARPGIVPGNNLPVFLPTGSRHSGVVVPYSAVVWWQGRAWFYAEQAPGIFVRRAIDASNPVSGGWFADGGIEPGTRIAKEGAETLLSEEFRSQIQNDED